MALVNDGMADVTAFFHVCNKAGHIAVGVDVDSVKHVLDALASEEPPKYERARSGVTGSWIPAADP
jgi:hypothetical protein